MTFIRVAAVRDNDGATCLHFAAARGHADCLRLLLAQPGVTGEEVDKLQATVRAPTISSQLLSALWFRSSACMSRICCHVCQLRLTISLHTMRRSKAIWTVSSC